MPTDISTAMLAEVRGRNRVHWVAEISDGMTTLRYAESDALAESESTLLGGGLYTDKILSWSDIPVSLGDDSFQLVDVRGSLQLYDRDRSFQHLLAESAAGAVLDLTFELWLRSFYVDESDHYLRMYGTLKNYRLVDDRIYEVVYGPNDEQLDEPLRFNAINKEENQFAFGTGGGDDVPDEAVGNPTRIVYGEQNSSGTDVSGAVEASFLGTYTPVGPTNYWFASWGGVVGDYRIWAGGTEKVVGTEVFVSVAIATSGKPYTRFNATEANIPSTDAVRFDVIPQTVAGGAGIASLPTGGIALRNPIAILRHILTNFVFQEWADATAWLTETGIPFNTELLDAAEEFCDVHGIVCSAVFEDSVTGRDVINAFASSFLANVFWTTKGEFAALFDDYLDRDTYLAEGAFLRQDEGHFLSRLTMEPSVDKVTKDLEVNYAYVGNSAQRHRRVSVAKLTTQGTLDVALGRAKV